MVTCPTCSAEQTEQSKFCSECGVALKPEFEATVTLEAPAANSGPAATSDVSHHGQFLPGAKIADRYRIVSLVGKGGMGEVYRADDLKLGHTVALKFLPNELAENPKRLEYFLSEVRLTRQISHPNVCRVYDVGEVDGQHFLSMEYIDGEDLRGLLRRIGRLAEDKGIEIAQQICAGLAAAHDNGVLHRDLKPANIMLDGRGQVRITDFGLAKLAAEQTEGEVVGTPAYMAPEQLTRGEATIQSDLYALGLILHELFTGEPAQKVSSIPELIRANEESSLSQTLEMPESINPAIRRAIARCLEKEPYDRPQSAHVVAGSLPGGDPLAAALAAGETPSPEMVAAAGGAGTLSLRAASILLAVLVVELVALVVFRGSNSVTKDLEYGTETYAVAVRDLPRDHLTFLDGDFFVKPNYEKYGISMDRSFLDNRFQSGAPAFWYRNGESLLVPQGGVAAILRNPNAVKPDNPPPLTDGNVLVKLNPKRALRELFIRDADANDDLSPSALKDPLLQAAKLNPDSYKIAEDDSWMPPLYAKAGHVVVYVPKDKANPEGVERIELAVTEGRGVWFRVVETAEGGRGANDRWKAFRGSKNDVVYWISMLLTCVALFLAWRNTIKGRTDKRSAWRLAVFLFCLHVLKLRLEAGFNLYAIRQSFLVAAASAFLIWIYYLAIEPYARRIWPTILTDWSRAMAGRWNDASLGKGVLIGAACGVFVTLLMELLEVPYQTPYALQALSGTRYQLTEALKIFLGLPVFYGTYIIIFLVLFRVIFRKDWLAAALTVFLMLFFWHDETLFSPSTFTIVAMTYYGLITTLLIRFGVAAAISLMFCHHLGERFPLSMDRIGPDVSTTVFVVITLLILAGYGFYTSVGGRRFFSNLSAAKAP